VNSETGKDRYANRPLLRLVDCYLLDLIGELPHDQAELLPQLVPRLQRTFCSARVTWQELVEDQLALLPEARNEIIRFWAGYQAHHRALGREVTPAEFVIEFTGQNFPDLLEDVQ